MSLKQSKKFLKPKTYQIKPNDTILIEDKIRLENKGENNSYTFYFSNDIKITKVYNNSKLQDLNFKELDIAANNDIVIKGLGFINIKKKTKIKIYLQDLDLVEIRKSFF